MEYPIEAKRLRTGGNELSLTVRALNPQMDVTLSLENVELVVKYRGGSG
jgi:hypothetical protein